MKRFVLAAALPAATLLLGCHTVQPRTELATAGSLQADRMAVLSRPIEYALEEIGDVSGEAMQHKVLFFTVAGDGAGVSVPILGGMGIHDPLTSVAAYRAVKSKGGDALYGVTTEWDTYNVLYLYQRKAVRVSGKALKLKNLGLMSEQRADELRKAKTAEKPGVVSQMLGR